MKITQVQLKKIQALFRKYGVVLAYLFGSQARETAGPASDTDIAVLLPKKHSKKIRFEIRLALMRECAKILKSDTDLVIFNDVSSLFFQYAILNEGKLIYQSSEEEALDFESRTLGRYFDFEPFLAAYNKQYVKNNL